MGIAGFWSYSHDDNERDGHALLRLAGHIQDEFALVTGETLTLFIDRNEVSWGDEWRRRIDATLAETTFFIPILTPLYFKRQECRRELLSFAGQAQSLGATELVMPILYVDVPDLTEDSSDEARALVARMQRVDWRELRLCPEISAEYRRAVHSLARRLAEISSRYEQTDNQSNVAHSGDADEEEGLLDLLGVIEENLPAWQEILDDSDSIFGQLDAIGNSYKERLKRTDNIRGNAGPRLAILRQFAGDLEPLLRRLVQDAKSYSAACIELDPVILRILHELDVFPEASSSVLQALSPIEAIGARLAEDKDPETESVMMLAKKYQRMSKDLGRVLRIWEAFERYADDADTLVLNWAGMMNDYKQRVESESDEKETRP